MWKINKAGNAHDSTGRAIVIKNRGQLLCDVWYEEPTDEGIKSTLIKTCIPRDEAELVVAHYVHLLNQEAKIDDA